MNRLGSEYTSRCTLHVTKLREFADYCTTKGWAEEPTKGDYEVLRMVRSTSKAPLLIYRKNVPTEHYTVSGVAIVLVAAYLRDTKHGKYKAREPDQTPSVVEAPEGVQAGVLESGTASTQENDPPWK